MTVYLLSSILAFLILLAVLLRRPHVPISLGFETIESEINNWLAQTSPSIQDYIGAEDSVIHIQKRKLPFTPASEVNGYSLFRGNTPRYETVGVDSY